MILLANLAIQISFPSTILILVCLGCHNKFHRLGGLNNRILLSHSSEAEKPKIKGASQFSFCWERPSWLAKGHLLLCPHMAEREKVLVLFFLGLQPPQIRPHFNYLLTIITFSQSLSPNTIIVEVQGFNTQIVGNKH